MKKYAEKFYSSKEWQDLREAYAKSKAYLCEDCLEHGIIEPGIICHHVIHITPHNITNREITLNPKNLRLLCRSCHERVHKTRPPRRYVVDEQGRVKAIGE